MRDEQTRRFFAAAALLGAAFFLAGLCLSPAAGLLAGLCAAGQIGLFALHEALRERRVAALTDAVTAARRGRADALLEDGREGELSVLQSELGKLALTLRERGDALEREKARLSDALADIAHQLRTPLTSAELSLSLAAVAPDARQRAEALGRAKAMLARADALITALLHLARLDAGIVPMKLEPTPVRALVASALEPLAAPMELHGVTADVRVPEGATLVCDAMWLGEALTNLLKNAMESAGDGGRLEIAFVRHPLGAALSVRDSGPGIPRGELAHLFDRFHRGEASHGAGIGLSLARAVVERHGGLLDAANHPEGGAVLTMRFAPK